MFGRSCPRCEASVRKSFDFCPSCGIPMKENVNREDYGLLGKDDDVEDLFEEVGLGGISGTALNKMLKGAMKMLEKEMTNLSDDMPDKRSNFQLYINGKRVGASQEEAAAEPMVDGSKEELPTPSEDIIEASKKLPRVEAKYKMKRLGTRIIYEIDLPGITSVGEVLINKLEDSTEIKAYTKKKVIHKTLQISLPLITYHVQKQKLILEFQGK